MVTEIELINQTIAEWIQDYYADGFFFLLAIGAFVYLYVTCKDLRYKFLLPIFLMIFIAVNPILYKYIFSRIIYWRLLWMLPNAILIAAAVVVFLKKQTKVWVKWGLLAVAAAFIISQGQYMFSDGVFSPRSNWEKLSQETIDVCDIILEIDDTPRIIAPLELSTEIRQYAPEIYMLYGRNMTNVYIRGMTYEEQEVSFNALKIMPPHYGYVFYMISGLDINFAVVESYKEVPIEILQLYGYEEIARTNSHIIYYNREM